MSSFHFDPSASGSLSFLALRSRWPYHLGAIAGLVLGASMLLLLFAAVSPGDVGPKAELLAIAGVALAGAMLGIAWLGVLRHGHGGAAPVVGSFALPLVIAAVLLDRDRHAAVMLVSAALAAFSWSHAIASGHLMLRAIAGLAGLLWTALLVGIVQEWSLPPVVVFAASGGIVLTGFGLGLSFPGLRRARTW